jgi:hypothetical protein
MATILRTKQWNCKDFELKKLQNPQECGIIAMVKAANEGENERKSRCRENEPELPELGDTTHGNSRSGM